MYTRYADQSETCSFQILQINSFKSVDTIRGYTSRAPPGASLQRSAKPPLQLRTFFYNAPFSIFSRKPVLTKCTYL
jgi:hypothetical protein